MLDYRNFDEVFQFGSGFTYDSSTVEMIEANRKSLEGFFIDKIFKLLDIKRPAKFYPPKSNLELKALHSTICAANGAEIYKLAVLYYVFLDCDAMAKRRTYSDAFAETYLLPEGYQICMKGFWHMDRLDFGIATQYLTHPSLVPTFPDEVLETLIHHSKHEDFTLPLAYYHTVKPSLKTPHAIESLFSALARTSVTEAFYFARVQTDTAHRRMFEMLISIVLHSHAGERAASRGVELLNLPFNREEEDWFEDYLTKGEGRGIKKAKDTLVMRRMGIGRFPEALSINIESGRTAGGLNWEMLQGGLQEGLGTRVDI